jgi:nitroimidazol reductase NimA-like FMN-containing flavoprotein (pyridoxamine 5'-phosphate oxidase superfamily)
MIYPASMSDSPQTGRDDITRAHRARPSAEEIAQVLAQRTTATVGTLNADGSIHLAYVAFLYADGLVYFDTASVTRKARNVGDRRQASVLVQGRAASGRHLMVSGEGTARILRGTEAKAVNHRVREKYAKPDVVAGLNVVWDSLDDIAVEITPARWRSWTSAPLREITSTALGVTYRDIWLPEE